MEDVSLINGRGGHGGSGGSGGSGGRGADGGLGEPGHPGYPGEPGEAGGNDRQNVNWSNSINWVALAGIVVAGIFWGGQKGTEIDNLKANQFGKEAGLSIKASVERVDERISEALARLDKVDAGGSQALKVIQERVSTLTAEVASQNIRCSDITRSVADLQRKTIENEIRIQNLIEAISPHDIKRGR